MTKPFLIVTIDGGAASGKSSTGRGLSERFNFLHVDTGSFYRFVTLKLLEAKVAPIEGPALDAALAKFKLGTELEGRRSVITIDGDRPDDRIRSETVNQNVSQFAALPTVRKFLLNYQRAQPAVAQKNGYAGLLMEGRDIGSVIFPDAPVRLFLEADPVKRAARRAKEGITDSIAQRDALDAARKTAPLACPQGATRIDSSDLNLEEVIALASTIVEKAISTTD